MTVRTKICGITNKSDAFAAVDAGADAIGFVFYAKSPRAITPLEALAITRQIPPFVARVGVFVNMPPAEIVEIRGQLGLSAIQLHGDEAPSVVRTLPGPVIKAFRGAVSGQQVRSYQTAGYLLDGDAGDHYGGRGVAADAGAAAALAGDPRFILAGGLTPETVGARIRQYRPAAVDVSSGVEQSPGRKSAVKMQAFVAAVRVASETAETGALAA